MKATLIPKELLTAYERWEMESFDDKPPVPDAPAAPQLTPEDVLRIKERAWQEGYEAGMEQGHYNGQQQGYDDGLNKGYQESQLQGWEFGHTSGTEKGLSDGHAEGYSNGLATGHKEGYETGYSTGKAEIEALTQRLQALATSFSSEVTQASEAMAAPMLALATDMCKAMLKTALQIKPDLIIPLIRDAIASLPQMQTPVSLHLHPEDANLVRTQMQEDITQHDWKIVETPDISRGGCKIETGSNQIDATVETRWKHLAETLHQQPDWLA